MLSIVKDLHLQLFVTASKYLIVTFMQHQVCFYNMMPQSWQLLPEASLNHVLIKTGFFFIPKKYFLSEEKVEETIKSIIYGNFTIYHQGFFHSVMRNHSLNCLHRRRSLAIVGHAGPRWQIRQSHLVLGLPCCLVHSRGVHSVTLFVHLLSLNRAMCPAYPCIPFLITSMILFTPV